MCKIIFLTSIKDRQLLRSGQELSLYFITIWGGNWSDKDNSILFWFGLSCFGAIVVYITQQNYKSLIYRFCQHYCSTGSSYQDLVSTQQDLVCSTCYSYNSYNIYTLFTRDIKSGHLVLYYPDL